MEDVEGVGVARCGVCSIDHVIAKRVKARRGRRIEGKAEAALNGVTEASSRLDGLGGKRQKIEKVSSPAMG